MRAARGIRVLLDRCIRPDGGLIAFGTPALHSDFRVTQQYLDLAGVDFAEEAERATARVFAHVPRAEVRAKVEAE